MSAVKTFDPKKLIITFGTQQLSGFAEGSFVTIGRDKESWNRTVGADGEGARARTNDKSGSMKLSLLQSSASNDYLSGILAADELNGTGVEPLSVKDASGRSLYAAETAWIEKPADGEFSQDVTNREWTIVTNELQVFVGGN